MKVKNAIIYLALFALIFSCQLFADEIENKTDRAKLGQAQSLINLSRFNEAVPILKDLHQRYPENKKITLELAKALGYGKKLNEAVVLFDELQMRVPDDEQIGYTYATVLESNEKLVEAREKYLELLQKNPSDDNIKLKIADISSWLKDYTTAITYYRHVLSKRLDDVLVKAKLADAYYWSDNYVEAVELYNELGPNLEADDKERAANLGYAYLKIGQSNKSVEVFKNLIRTNPDDVELRLALVNVFQTSGNIDEAKQELKKIIMMQPQNTNVMLKLVEILAVRQEYEQAIDRCKQILQTDPNHRTTKLWLARILSWSKKYDESLAVYMDIIEGYPEWIEPSREKARVLGWTRKYKESVQEYQKTLEQNPLNQAVYYEMLAKRSLYNISDIDAIKYYNKWLELEPANLEALYDLGQVYSRQNRWADANQMYNQVLDIFPDHFRCKQALEKVNIYSSRSKLTTGFEFFEADSSGRTMDKRYWNVFASVSKPLSKDYYLQLRQDNIWYNFKAFSQIYQQRFRIDLDYYKKPEFWANVNYAHSIYREEKGLQHTFGGQLNYVPQDLWTINLSHQREQIVDNSTTFRDSLYRDNYKVRTSFRPNRKIYAALDYMRSCYSDDNNRDAYGLDLGYFVSLEPKSLKVSYRYEEYQFDREDVDYFSPDSFHYHRAALEWRHFLNKEELFWSANDTYYTLRYEINFDVKQENGHKLGIDLHHDWNNNCSSHLEWSKTIYEHSDTYSENRLMFYTSFYF